MELCLFQGTFNPIHKAHLRVAEFVSDFYNCKVTFIPAFHPPHKNYDSVYSQHRLNMVKLAVSNNEKFDVSDIEYNFSGKSYTYLTICKLYEKFKPVSKIKFIIGTDAFRKIESWYESEKLKDKLKFLVFKRDKDFDRNELNYLAEKGYDFEFMPLDFMDISSTKLRETIKAGGNYSELVPKKVEEYIRGNGLYKD